MGKYGSSVNDKTKTNNSYTQHTVFPHIRPAGIIILHSLQMRVLLENTTFLLHKIVRIAGIIRDAGIIRGRALYEEIWYSTAKLKGDKSPLSQYLPTALL